MSQGKWTRAKVKHKGLRYYWIRWRQKDVPRWTKAVVLLSDAAGEFTSICERWSEPIPEPPN